MHSKTTYRESVYNRLEVGLLKKQSLLVLEPFRNIFTGVVNTEVKIILPRRKKRLGLLLVSRGPGAAKFSFSRPSNDLLFLQVASGASLYLDYNALSSEELYGFAIADVNIYCIETYE